MKLDYKKEYSNFSSIRELFVSEFFFLKSNEYFEEFTVKEDLSVLGMGYRLFIITEEIMISLTISTLERRSELKLCKRDSKLSSDWSVLKSTFNAKSFFNLSINELSSDTENIKRYIIDVSAKFASMLKEQGVENTIARLK